MENIKRRTSDFNLRRIGQKHRPGEVLEQAKFFLAELKKDNESFEEKWQELPITIFKLFLKTPFVFDYVKYEILRAEINFGVRVSKS